MAALTATTPTRTGAVIAGAAVGSTDTIAASIVGNYGCVLVVINGNASPDVVTVSDASTTLSGGAAAAISTSVTNATSRAFLIKPVQVDSTGVVTITHSVTATVTYQLIPLG